MALLLVSVQSMANGIGIDFGDFIRSIQNGERRYCYEVPCMTGEVRGFLDGCKKSRSDDLR